MRLRIRAQPRASRTEVAGEHGDFLKVRVAAPPVDGDANRELVRFIAKRVGVPTSSVTVIAGVAARNKVIEVRGVAVAAIVEALAP